MKSKLPLKIKLVDISYQLQNYNKSKRKNKL